MEILRAVARGTMARASGWMPLSRAKRREVAFCKRYLARLKGNRRWGNLFKVAGNRDASPGGAKLARERLIEEIKADTGYESSVDELIDVRLAVVLGRAAAYKLTTPQVSINERDLY